MYRQVEAEAKPKNFREYVLAFYEKRKAGLLTPEAYVLKDAVWVARSLGLPDSTVPGAE